MHVHVLQRGFTFVYNVYVNPCYGKAVRYIVLRYAYYVYAT